MTAAVLVLEDGAVFEGESFGSEQEALGEVVFNTGMTGYQEVLTDPSYRGQIVAMTYPHIGNYGVNDQDLESSEPRVAGFVVRDLPGLWSSWRGRGGLSRYLNDAGITGITEVDTRRLTRHIRDRGAMRGVIALGGKNLKDLKGKAQDHPSMVGADLVSGLAGSAPYEWPGTVPAGFRVAALDFGIKRNILRRLSHYGCATTVFPASTSAQQILDFKPDGVFVSNGPGDPEAVVNAVEVLGALIGKVPIFGICLGHQLMALAVGLETYKMPFGHHGSNHPVARLADGSVQITTQNHGFAVTEKAFGYQSLTRPGQPLPVGATAQTKRGRVQLTHINLNDYTVEGFRLLDQPVFCVQFHPEAGPGPHDSDYLFGQFCAEMSGSQPSAQKD